MWQLYIIEYIFVFRLKHILVTIGPFFKGQASFDCLVLGKGTDTLSWIFGKKLPFYGLYLKGAKFYNIFFVRFINVAYRKKCPTHVCSHLWTCKQYVIQNL